MILLIYFALPIATILLAIVLQKILRCPILVGITFFAIYLIVSFVAFSCNLAEALIATIVYSIIAFITAYIDCVISRLLRRLCLDNNSCRCNCGSGRDNNSCGCRCNCGSGRNDDRCRCCCDNENSTNELLSISCNCANGGSSNLLTVNSNCLQENNNRNIDDNEERVALANQNENCNCNCNNRRGNDVAITANFTPCQNNGGRTGFVRGCYRRM